MARRMISATNQDWYWLGAYAGARRHTSALSIGISWSPRSRRTMPKNQQALDECGEAGRRKSVAGLGDDEKAASNTSSARTTILITITMRVTGR